MFIGLMGVGNNNMLITPKGRNLFKVPKYVAIVVQRVQHWIAGKTWK